MLIPARTAEYFLSIEGVAASQMVQWGYWCVFVLVSCRFLLWWFLSCLADLVLQFILFDFYFEQTGFDAAMMVAAFLRSQRLGCLPDRLLDWSCLCALCRTSKRKTLGKPYHSQISFPYPPLVKDPPLGLKMEMRDF